ncbi:MAG TPA: Ig-like domain-containing protein, partial [Longimicrobium sp.]
MALGAALLAAAPGLSAQQSGQPIRGDVDGDGRVTAADARIVANYLVGRAVPAGADVAGRGDANGDGRVTSADAAIINAFAAGRDMKRFPVGTPIAVVPNGPDKGLAAILCGADVRAKTVKCDAPTGATGARGVLLGNQHVYVELTSSNVSSVDNAGTIDFTFDVTVKNLIPQTLGVDSATGAVNAEAVRVFFATAPVADAGSGEIDVQGGGTGTFTASNQHYYEYPAPLATNSVTPPVNWHFQMPNTVTHFQFLVYVAGKVQFPQGWIDIYPPSHAPSPTLIPTNTITAGSTLQLEDTARTQVGNPIPGESVTWSSTGHATTVDPNTGLVTATGVGTDTITATGNSGRTGKVQIVVNPGAAASMTANSATTQSANAGTAVAAPPSVIVKDALNNPVPGVSVTFTTGATSGTVSDGSTTGSAVTITTNASGIATLTSWTVGNTVGVDSVTASSTGLTDVVFTATVTPGAPASMTANSAPTQSDTVGKPVAAPPSVLVKDALNNPVPGVTVTFNVTAGGGSVNNGSTSGASVTVNTDASGIATLASWTLGTASGTSNNTVKASATGLTDVTFTATAEPDVPFTIAKTAGDNQTVTAGTAVPIKPKVHITDQYGNVVATGTTVTFTPSAGGSVTGGTTSTDGSGDAEVGSWTLAAGANTLTVTSGTATATFNGYGNSLPVAGRDSVDGIGNVQITATGLKGNDSDADGDAISITAVPVPPAHGSISIDVDGGLTYTPAVGYVGLDSATYTLTDARGGTAPGKVIIRMPDRFWFVTGGGSGNGTQASPSGNFTFGSPIAAKDTVFLLSSATVSAGLALPNGAALIGTGLGSNVTRSLGGSPNMTVNPVTLLTSGSQPTLTVSTGTGVTLASSGTGYVVKGLNLTSSAGAALAGSTFGTLDVANLAVTATGGPALNLATGTVSGTFTSVSGSGSSTHGAILSAVGGTFTVSGGTITGSANGAALQVTGNAAGTVNWAGSLSQANAQPLLLVTGHTNTGATLNLTGALTASGGSRGLTFDNADGIYLIIPSSPTTFTGDSVGVDILNGSSSTNFTFGPNLTLNGTAGNAFNLDASSAAVTFQGNITKNGTQTGRLVSISNHTIRTIAFPGTLSATSTAAGSTGILLDNADGTYNFSGTNTLGGAGSDAGIDVQNGSLAAVTFSSNTSITNPLNEAVRIDAGAAGLGFTYNGTISKTNGSGTGIALTNNGTGNISFAGPSVVLNTGTSAGINMTSTAATVSFVDSVKVTTTSGNGINATGGGTLTIAGTHNSITSAGGIALNVSGTTIGGAGLNFRSISANGGANGIVLSSTGAGGLTVSGNGTAGSGGTIQNTSGADGAIAGNGVYLSSAQNVSLAFMAINDHGNNGL